MRVPQRGQLAVLGFLVAAVVIEVVSLRAKTTGIVVIGAVCGIAAVVVIARGSVAKIGLGAAYLCAFTLTWNGWFLGPVRPGDVLILLTLALLLVANPNVAFRTPPWWVKQLAVAIILIALITVLVPIDPLYLSHRLVLGAQGVPTVDYKGTLTTAILGVAFKYVVAVFATPVAFTGAALIDRRAPRRLGIAFAAGTALSGWAATLDHLGANIGHLITHIPNVGGRQFGFALHPNFLAAGLVLGIPFAFWLVASHTRREQLLGAVSLIGLLGGVYASGSRGGAVCAVAVVALCVVLHPRTRGYTPTIALAGVVALGVVAGLVPSVGQAILKATRLAGGITTSGSDQVRALVGAQGVRDFQHSPIYGVGLQASFDASQVYLQELASGGLILFVAMQIYMGGAIFTSLRCIRRNDLAVAISGALIATLALNIFEADLTDRFYYVPAAILIAMVHTLDTDRDAEADSAAVPDQDVEDHLAAQHRQPVRT